MLIGLMAPIYSEVMEEVESLLLLADRSHIDVDATANIASNIRRNSPEEVVGKNQFKSIK